MTALSNRNRVQVNGALAIIHGAGHDASAVTRAARDYQTAGRSAKDSYEAALSDFTRSMPDLANAVQKTVRLIGASDEATVARYDHALTHYNQSGNESALQALAPMMARDAVALAVKHGEITADDLATGGVEAALGYAPTDEMQAAGAGAFDEAPAASPFAGQSFSFAKPEGQGQPAAASPGSFVNGTQSGPFVTGFRAPRSGEALAREVGLPMAYAVAQGLVDPA